MKLQLAKPKRKTRLRAQDAYSAASTARYKLGFYWETLDPTYLFQAWNAFAEFPWSVVRESYKLASRKSALADLENRTNAMLRAGIDDAASRYNAPGSLAKFINRVGRRKDSELNQLVYNLMNMYRRGFPPDFIDGTSVKDAARQVRHILSNGHVRDVRIDMTEAAVIKMWRRRRASMRGTK